MALPVRTESVTDSTATGGTRAFRFGVVAPLRTDPATWRDRVRRIADSGYSTLLMPDVPQWQPAPGPALAVAAAIADLRVGTWVYASPVRPPWSTAWEAHSLSVLTDGRFEMGIGTGRPGIEDQLRELGLPVAPPSERLDQVRQTVAQGVTSVTEFRRRQDSELSQRQAETDLYRQISEKAVQVREKRRDLEDLETRTADMLANLRASLADVEAASAEASWLLR